MKFKEGDEVTLKANPREGWKEEKATVLGYSGNGTYCVEVRPEDQWDDGIREVTTDQMSFR